MVLFDETKYLGCWCILFSIGFLILSCLPYKMPKYYQEEDYTKESFVIESNFLMKCWNFFITEKFILKNALQNVTISSDKSKHNFIKMYIIEFVSPNFISIYS